MKKRKRSFNYFISAVRLLLLSSKNAKEYEQKPKTEGKQDDDKTVHDPDTSVERTILSKLSSSGRTTTYSRKTTTLHMPARPLLATTAK
jgi:hypothetical protein